MDRIILDMENVRTCSSLLHDSMCEEWTYEYSSKRLTMHIRYDEEKSAFKNVVFECVAAHNMVSCDYWGPSPYIFGIELIASESSFLYKQLTDEIKNMCYVILPRGNTWYKKGFLTECLSSIKADISYLNDLEEQIKKNAQIYSQKCLICKIGLIFVMVGIVTFLYVQFGIY